MCFEKFVFFLIWLLREFGDSLNKIESETIQTDKEQTIRPFFLEEKGKKVFLLERE